MIYFDKQNLRACDVDDTLIMHRPNKFTSAVVDIENPYDGITRRYDLNRNMIKLIREEHARGNPILVWSRRGAPWAKAVVEALQLTDIVSLIMDKPMVYFDDKDVSEWMRDRVYIGPDESFK